MQTPQVTKHTFVIIYIAGKSEKYLSVPRVTLKNEKLLLSI